jgi:hypothetical protein
VRITTRAEYRWNETEGRYVCVYEEGYDLPAGSPVALCKGPSSSQTSIAAGQQGFANTLTQDYGTTFANQASTLKNLTNSLTSTVNGGPGQYGFGAQEDKALRTQSDTGTAGAYQAAKQATGEGIAAAGGGNAVIPQGVTSELNSQNANAAAATQSNQQLGITNAGYQQGNANYNNAISGLSQVSSIENPNATAGQATSAGNAAYGSAQANQQMANQSNPWNIASGILGGAASAAVGGLMGNPSGVMSGLSSMFGKSAPPSITAGGTGEGQLGNPFTAGNMNMPGMSSAPVGLPSF